VSSQARTSLHSDETVFSFSEGVPNIALAQTGYFEKKNEIWTTGRHTMKQKQCSVRMETDFFFGKSVRSWQTVYEFSGGTM